LPGAGSVALGAWNPNGRDAGACGAAVGGGDDVVAASGLYPTDQVSHMGGGDSVKLPALATRPGSGSALFEYQDTSDSLCDVTGSVLFEYQAFDCP